MIFPKRSKSGSVLVDILVAIAIAAVFSVIMFESSYASRQIFTTAHERSLALDDYYAGRFMAATTSYGRGIEKIEYNSTSSSIRFVQIRHDPQVTLKELSLSPSCTSDFGNSFTIGSYQWFASDDNVIASTTAIFVPTSGAGSLTDVSVRDGLAYTSSDSSVNSDPDLVVMDIRNASQPKLVAVLNTGPGISAITFAGRYIFAAAASTAGQLHIIRLDDPAHPVLQTKYKLPLPYATATPPLGSSIAVRDGTVFLGTEKWDGDEFDIIDVTDVSHPTKISGLEIGSKVTAITLDLDIAYVASAGQNQLTAVDISDLTHPRVVATVSPSGWQRQEGKVILRTGNGLLFGRTSGGYDIATDHEFFSWSTTSQGTFANPQSTNAPGGIYGMVADAYRIFDVTRTSSGQFEIRKSAEPTKVISTSSLGNSPEVMTCDGRHVYVLSHNSPYIYDILFK